MLVEPKLLAIVKMFLKTFVLIQNLKLTIVNKKFGTLEEKSPRVFSSA